ncbi:MAG: LysM peptidoglycan-binding domain-containing protein [Sphingobacteriales bacterium]
MKFRILLLVTLLLTSTTALFANSLRDSIGVENKDGKKIILHKVDPKDNYYSIGRRYKVSPKAIIQYNNNATMQIGVIIKVPTDRPFLESSYNTPQKPQPTHPVVVKQHVNAPAAAQEQKAEPEQKPIPTSSNAPTQDYKISAGETLYSIAKRFGTTVEDITNINGLTSTTLSPGQIIKVRTGQAPAPVTAKPDATSVVVTADSANAVKFNANHFGLYERDEKGVATWMDDADLDPNKKLVLHRTAPIGTVIKITNPMTNLTTYAKVVGRFTDNEANKDVIIVVTKNVADSLGALDKRFHVNISYGSPNE